jgi:tyrosine-protein phosphatase YwqE
MFSILNKTKNNTSLDWIGIDIHSHFLPGLDDGCADAAVAVRLISRLKLLGISKVYTTPHVYKDLYPNTRDTINDALVMMQEELQKAGAGVELSAAAEYMADPDFELLYQSEELICLPDRHVLLEMSCQAESPFFELYLFTLQAMGYKPILAHPERYVYYHDDMSRYRHFRDLGCLFQMNLLSPAGYYGPEVKKTAMKLLKAGMIDLVGTDIHRARDLYTIEKFVLSGYAHKIFKKNPIKNAQLFSR